MKLNWIQMQNLWSHHSFSFTALSDVTCFYFEKPSESFILFGVEHTRSPPHDPFKLR